jgi:hypothetical protein
MPSPHTTLIKGVPRSCAALRARAGPVSGHPEAGFPEMNNLEEQHWKGVRNKNYTRLN